MMIGKGWRGFVLKSVVMLVSYAAGCTAAAADVYPDQMMGAWGGRAAHMGDDNPAVASQACASFRKNPKHVLGDVLVFKANRKFSYGGYADYVDTNVSVKRLAPNT